VEVPLNQAWLEAVMLAGVRMVTFLVIAPPFSYNAFPLRIKAMLAIGLALAVSSHAVPGYEPLSTAGFVGALTVELLTGAVLGFLVMLVFAAVQSAGNLIDLFGGFQLAQAFDPQSMVNGAQFTRLFQMTALALLFVSDGYQLILGGLANSFTAFPLGQGVDLAGSGEVMISAVTGMFLAAVQSAGPLLVILFLADIGLGLLTRVAPALNAFALGFPLKILLTLIFSAVVFVALPRIVSSVTGDAVSTMMGVK
jgi:flagellar biosynthetic protein FliR